MNFLITAARMKKIYLPLRLRLFLPVSLIITIVVVTITFYFVKKSIVIFNEQIESNLRLEVQTISKMFEREATLKLDKVKSNLKVASAAFLNIDFRADEETFKTEINNQVTGKMHTTELNRWFLDNTELFGDNSFVDSLQNMLGGTVTIFQKSDSGFVRISTNVLTEEGKRAVGTYIPYDSPVSLSVMKGETYYGRAFVVNDWYVTAYQPLFIEGEVEGMIYVGDKEKDLDELKRILLNLEIGESGYPFVFDKSGILAIHPEREGEDWSDSTLFREVLDMQSGVLRYLLNGREKVMAFDYFKDFELYVAASVFPDIETRDLRRDAILGAVITGGISILLLLGFIYYFTTEKIFRFFTELKRSREKLYTVSRALEESEERYRKLFDSTGDDIFVTDVDENIVEVNIAACETLGYNREELLEMKISDIKPEKYREQVAENRRIIFKKGSHAFESEHITRSGKIIKVEFTSRLVNYGNEKLILSVVRNISRRAELERQILSAVIRGEERERKRFAREMHDGLGPLLSAAKLYVNELDSMTLSEEERKDLIRHSNELIDEAVNATRTISNNLMPTVINSYGLVKAVQAFCEKVNRTNQLNIKFETENIDRRLDTNVELILFRVISELINNTIKHARAENVQIFLVKKDDILTLYFRDDGVGFVVDDIINSDNKGMGLKNIISRIRSINGTYNFNSRPGEGFNIKIEINV